jgi:uncharacterized membrane protein
MDKAKFLHILRKNLRFKLPRNEREEIIADYREYFAAGAEEGKSEEQLAVEFGAPEAIVRELMNERQTESGVADSLRQNAVRLIAALLFLLLYIFCFKSDMWMHAYNMDLWMTLFLPLILIVGRVDKLFTVKTQYVVLKLVPICFTVSLLLILLNVLIIGCFGYFLTNVNRMVQLQSAMQTVSILNLFWVVLCVSSVVIAVLLLLSGTRIIFAGGLHFLNIGLFITAKDTINILQTGTSNIEHDMNQFARALYPTVAGVALMILYCIIYVIKTRVKGERT